MIYTHTYINTYILIYTLTYTLSLYMYKDNLFPIIIIIIICRLVEGLEYYTHLCLYQYINIALDNVYPIFYFQFKNMTF